MLDAAKRENRSSATGWAQWNGGLHSHNEAEKHPPDLYFACSLQGEPGLSGHLQLHLHDERFVNKNKWPLNGLDAALRSGNVSLR